MINTTKNNIAELKNMDLDYIKYQYNKEFKALK
jgi:hypothetical protein